ncbi:MAG TPA: DUF5668 domain-containing protein [Bryobacteraceae bacterium]|nr:DUF5668 domain-containing protein [Bryobacteraceae bacterium]
MEQFDNYNYWRHGERGGLVFRSNSGLIPGLILVGVGALFFLNNLHIFYIRDWFRFWPAILVAAGIVKLVDSTYPSGRVLGGILAGFGGIFLARALGFVDIGMREIWPLFLVGLGLLLLVQRNADWQMKLQVPGAPQVSKSGNVKVDAVLGGSKRVVTSQSFRGGEVTAVFGGVELDLRQANITEDSAVIEINAVFGGVEMKIPRNWSAVVQGIGIFGGYADNTVQPEPVLAPGVKQLIVRGAAVFGGVEVKN